MILNGFCALCSGLQRGDRPVASGRKSRQRALGRVDAAGHPAVLHRLQTTGPAQHEMETATGSSSPTPKNLSADFSPPHCFIFSSSTPLFSCPRSPKQMRNVFTISLIFPSAWVFPPLLWFLTSPCRPSAQPTTGSRPPVSQSRQTSTMTTLRATVIFCFVSNAFNAAHRETCAVSCVAA